MCVVPLPPLEAWEVVAVGGGIVPMALSVDFAASLDAVAEDMAQVDLQPDEKSAK